MNDWLKITDDGIILCLRIIPRSSRDAVDGVLGDVLKIRLTAPPVEGKANAALMDFLSDRLNVPRSQITLVSGSSGRRKNVRVRGLTPQIIRSRLLPEGPQE